MRRYKPDIMTVLIVLVAIGVIASTSIQAQEFTAKRPLQLTAMAACPDISHSHASCTSGSDMILGISGEGSQAGDKLWLPHSLSVDEAPLTAPLFALEDHSCKSSRKSSQSLMNTEFSDMKIGLSRYLTFDFEMEDIRRFEISSIYLGFKDCW